MPDVPVEDSPIVPKQEHSREGSLSSLESSPELDAEGELDSHVSPPASVQIQKRKGGRKPIYATSEERKQRNRQAQAAFRERRTEYIKQLETTIKHQDESLQNLQQNHRSAADECLMLRYKNSLLERILLEKGIDVQAELKRKEITAPGKVPPSLPQPTPIQRAAMGRHHHVPRSASHGGSSSFLHKANHGGMPVHSPQLQPTPPSQGSSPVTSRSPIFGVQGGMNPPQAGFQAQPQPQQHLLQPQLKGAPYQGVSVSASGAGLPAVAAGAAGTRAATRPSHWPSPFQTHMEQLEREYHTHPDLLDDPDQPEDADVGPGPYPQPSDPSRPYPPSQNARLMQPQSTLPDGAGQQMAYDSTGQAFDPYDPMLDADPFGLTASMHFPTQFSFQESSMRK